MFPEARSFMSEQFTYCINRVGCHWGPIHIHHGFVGLKYKELRGKFAETEINHYGLKDCEKEEVTDDDD